MDQTTSTNHHLSYPDKKASPVPDDSKHAKENPAAQMIRRKLEAIYAAEPAAKKELAEAQQLEGHLSKHQKFIRQLAASGKSLPEIQTAWHNYYVDLPAHDKHAVWQEFYDASRQSAPASPTMPTYQLPPAPKVFVNTPTPAPSPVTITQRSVGELRQQVTKNVKRRSRLKPKHHLQSLAFGLGAGGLAVFIVLFGFFNQLLITPLIQPSRHVSATPLIVTADSVAPTSTPEVIIPKINVQIPVDYNQSSTNEAVIESALNNGVVHYPNTVVPGQNGNAAYFGHSSNNIFNPGKYKFAFVLLHTLVVGDTFYLTYNSKVYAYQVISRQIVPPSDVGVLADTHGQTATATLITCDPPGTSINRLVVTGEQVSPSPSNNTAPATPSINTPTVLASNGPSLWYRIWHNIL